MFLPRRLTKTHDLQFVIFFANPRPENRYLSVARVYSKSNRNSVC